MVNWDPKGGVYSGVLLQCALSAATYRGLQVKAQSSVSMGWMKKKIKKMSQDWQLINKQLYSDLIELKGVETVTWLLRRTLALVVVLSVGNLNRPPAKPPKHPVTVRYKSGLKGRLATLMGEGISFISIWSDCSHDGLVADGIKLLPGMTRDFSILPKLEHYGCLIELLCKAGLLDNDLDLIKNMMVEPNSRIWSTLPGGWKLQKNCEMVCVAVKKLFHLQTESINGGGIKNVALITPVVFGLCTLVANELGGKDLSANSEKKLLKKVVNLLKLHTVEDKFQYHENVDDGFHDDRLVIYDLDSSVCITDTGWDLSKCGTRTSIQRMRDPAANLGVKELVAAGCQIVYLSKSFLFEMYHEQMFVTLKEGLGFLAMDPWGTSDPCVVLQLDVHVPVAKSEARWRTRDPTCNEELLIAIAERVQLDKMKDNASTDTQVALLDMNMAVKIPAAGQKKEEEKALGKAGKYAAFYTNLTNTWKEHFAVKLKQFSTVVQVGFVSRFSEPFNFISYELFLLLYYRRRIGAVRRKIDVLPLDMKQLGALLELMETLSDAEKCYNHSGGVVGAAPCAEHEISDFHPVKLEDHVFNQPKQLQGCWDDGNMYKFMCSLIIIPKFGLKARENEADLIKAASMATPETMAFIGRHGTGIVCVSMKGEDLERLQLPQMINQKEKEEKLTTTTTGFSTCDRAATIPALASEDSKPDDCDRPGHICPLRDREDGVLKRAGHTKASLDLAVLAGFIPAKQRWKRIVKDPEIYYLLPGFLPVLLFGSTSTMDGHPIKSCATQMILLTVLGHLISTCINGSAVKFFFHSGRQWGVLLLLGPLPNINNLAAVMTLFSQPLPPEVTNLVDKVFREGKICCRNSEYIILEEITDVWKQGCLRFNHVLSMFNILLAVMSSI